MRTELVIIDPQFDFCDSKGNLYVNGADKDMERLAKMIDRNHKKINQIDVTLDSHQPVHIAHPLWWVDSNRKDIPIFTSISVEDVESGKYLPRKMELFNRSLDYVKTLRNNKRYQLTIWPEHC